MNSGLNNVNGANEDEDDDEDDNDEEEVDVGGQLWTRLSATLVNTDARILPRANASRLSTRAASS